MRREIFYTTKKIKDFRMAIISDIHYTTDINHKILDNIIKEINKNNPDYILILGDIIDSSDLKELDGLRDFLEELASIKPTIAITGNHDEKSGYRHHWHYEKNNELIKLLKSIDNFYYLNDSSVTINNIKFYGFNLPYNYYDKDEPYELFEENIKDLKPDLNNKNYNVTLIHSPINIYPFLNKNKDHNLQESDLILSGHMHNGCIPYWFTHIINKVFHTTRSLISPSGELFIKYSQGRVYERDGYIFDGINKLSKATRSFHKFNFIYSKRVTFIDIKHK